MKKQPSFDKPSKYEILMKKSKEFEKILEDFHKEYHGDDKKSNFLKEQNERPKTS